MNPQRPGHAAYVDAWLTRTADRLPPDKLAALFERASRALWLRAHRTLGEVTLMAIGDRVLVIASEKYPFLSTLKIDGSGIRFDEFRQAEHEDRFREGMRLVLVEFLTVIGNLTGEILTPALHAELAKVVVEGKRRAAGSPRGTPRTARGESPGDKGADR